MFSPDPERSSLTKTKFKTQNRLFISRKFFDINNEFRVRRFFDMVFVNFFLLFTQKALTHFIQK